MGSPAIIAWEEPWREQFPLVVPLRAWLRIWPTFWAELGRPALIALPLCGLIIWLVRKDLPAEVTERLIWLPPKLGLLLMILPVFGYYASALLIRCVYILSPPFAEVSRQGIRVPLRFYPYSKIQTCALVREGEKAWLTFTSGREERKSEIPADVDLAALQSLLDARDAQATNAPVTRSKYVSELRLHLAALTVFAGFVVVSWVFVALAGLIMTGRIG